MSTPGLAPAGADWDRYGSWWDRVYGSGLRWVVFVRANELGNRWGNASWTGSWQWRVTGERGFPAGTASAAGEAVGLAVEMVEMVEERWVLWW
ncbi:hypothetical protein Dda_8101 [Drechslerella dactyloides]|uniref:Uncharacterized protein n=1 Tax=Drechslerella dactyloides TaxID=74499 RepID=A0AAD6NGC9_DREDA|nr:hypothetical protein Dda_8101 [Drechslerella dactyloides]